MALKTKYMGLVNQGVFIPDDKKYYLALAKRNNKRTTITIGSPEKMQSCSQRRYYWAVVVEIIADYFGYTPEEMHEIFKPMFFKEHNDKGFEYIKSTTAYLTVEFEAKLSNIRRWAATRGIYIPLPNEVQY
jgi:hypothetical protein